MSIPKKRTGLRGARNCARPRQGQGRGQGRPKRGPRAAKSSHPGEALERHGPPGGPKMTPKRTQERSKRGPRPDGKRLEQTRADKAGGRARQQADKRSSGATKPRTPWPVSHLLLVHLMHQSTRIHTDFKYRKVSRESPIYKSKFVLKAKFETLGCFP